MAANIADRSAELIGVLLISNSNSLSGAPCCW
jgi:hypothetical protein